jgi:hypothetical protein
MVYVVDRNRKSCDQTVLPDVVERPEPPILEERWSANAEKVICKTCEASIPMS